MNLNDKLMEFNYWLISEEGMYYRELLSASLVAFLFIVIIVSSLITILLTKNYGMLILIGFFAWRLFKISKRIIKMYRKKTWYID